jgi:hypothetical protein
MIVIMIIFADFAVAICNELLDLNLYDDIAEECVYS